MLKSKIHRATVTQADLHYVGSCTIDAELMKTADLLEGEQIDIVDSDNGHRLTTYSIAGEASTGVIGFNGAAAHLISPGDLVIIIGYAQYTEEELGDYSPRIVFVNKMDKIGADYFNCVRMIKDRTGGTPCRSPCRSAPRTSWKASSIW